MNQAAAISDPDPMRPLIPEASAADTAAVKACVVRAFELYIERMGKPPGPMLLDFPARIEAKQVWLAESGGGVAGVLVQYPTALGFYIDTVAVLPQRQGTGVGKALLRFAEREALRRGYDSIYLCTNAKMTENQVFYPRIGYVEYERSFSAGYDRVFYRKALADSGGLR